MQPANAEQVAPTSGAALAPAERPRDFTWSVTFDMIGLDWEWVNALHGQYRFHENWPDGMLCHFTGPVSGGVRTIGIWTDRAQEQEYFRKTAIEVITNSVRELGPPPAGDQAGDFEPVARDIHRLALTHACEAFADIGEDADASAINALGTQPVTARFEFSALDAHDYDATIAQLGWGAALPEGMLLALTERRGPALIETQIWSSEAIARETLEAGYIPAMSERMNVEARPTYDRLNRISFGGDALRRALGD